QLYAYRDACARCGAGLAGGLLRDGLLECPVCAESFDVRLAGRSTGGERHLDPLPLLDDGDGVRVAVPQAS
ncbi:MAG: hypothetical protein M3467_12005, partial [Actinomycetota bacterium]|nr:hypothetical protein [Actinomycetota bacterium]